MYMKRTLWAIALATIILALAPSCKHKTAPVPDTTDYDAYYHDATLDTTPAALVEWLQRVGIDSAERTLCRHAGSIRLDDTTLSLYFVDLLRHLADQAMDYPFDELAEKMEMDIKCSDDGRVRVFYWNTWLGGTCPDIERYTLLKGDDGHVHLLEEGHDSPQLLDIYQLTSSQGERVYLMHEYFREWSSYGAAWVWCCHIKGNTLDTLPLFPHGDSAIGTEYNIPEWYFIANDGEGWEWLFELHDNKLYVPVVVDNGITDRYILYQWDGQRLDSVGNVGNRRLHPSLQNYNNLCSYFVTSGFRVRVDDMGDGTFRYASWPRSKQPSAKPDLVVYDGTHDEHSGQYVFHNDGYTYRTGDISRSSGVVSQHGLSVEKEGKVLLHQEKDRE